VSRPLKKMIDPVKKILQLAIYSQRNYTIVVKISCNCCWSPRERKSVRHHGKKIYKFWLIVATKDMNLYLTQIFEGKIIQVLINCEKTLHLREEFSNHFGCFKTFRDLLWRTVPKKYLCPCQEIVLTEQN